MLGEPYDRLGQLRDRLLQTFVPALQILKPLRLVELQAAVLTPPLVVRLLRDPEAAADLAHRLALTNPHLSFAQRRDDFLSRSSFRAMSTSPFERLKIARFETHSRSHIWGAGQ